MHTATHSYNNGSAQCTEQPSGRDGAKKHRDPTDTTRTLIAKRSPQQEQNRQHVEHQAALVALCVQYSRLILASECKADVTAEQRSSIVIPIISSVYSSST